MIFFKADEKNHILNVGKIYRDVRITVHIYSQSKEEHSASLFIGSNGIGTIDGSGALDKFVEGIVKPTVLEIIKDIKGNINSIDEDITKLRKDWYNENFIRV